MNHIEGVLQHLTLNPISSHATTLLFLQAAALLIVARLLAEAMRRMGQPEVIGELLAGVLFGPSLLGHFAPQLFFVAFPPNASQFHLLEVVANLGMVLLLLLTGLETDLQVMRTLGRAAATSSLFGMLVPFVAGFAMAWWLPPSFYPPSTNHFLFAAFVATAMAISAVPVIAKILMDLDLTHRDLGVLILSAGVVDDTTGWLLLSVIAGIASAHSFAVFTLLRTMTYLGLYLAMMRWAVFPLLCRLMRYVNEHVNLAGADVTLILGFTFLSSAITQAIGVHAVFGAFVMGMLIRQVPRVKRSSLHTIEIFVLATLSPIFFAYAGIKVDLWAMHDWKVPVLVIVVATIGKLTGCYFGARIGKLSRLESLAIGFGMNARGAMELIVALIGLSLGVLTPEMYSIIVMVAVVTSFMAPLLLRTVLDRLPMREEERRRIEHERLQRILPAGPLRVLLPVTDTPFPKGALHLSEALTDFREGELRILHLQSQPRRRWFGRRRPAEAFSAELGHLSRRANYRRIETPYPGPVISNEAAHDYDLIVLPYAGHERRMRTLWEDVLGRTQVPVVLMGDGQDFIRSRFERIVVPVSGSFNSKAAAEFAFAYAQTRQATVTLVHIIDATRSNTAAGAAGEIASTEEQEMLERIRAEFSVLAQVHSIDFEVKVLASDDPIGQIFEESRSQRYDLLVLGAERNRLAKPILPGHNSATTMLERAGCPCAVVLPYLQ